MSEEKIRQCNKHPEAGDLTMGQECPTCVVAWENRTDSELMTPEERVVEMQGMNDVLQIDFSKFHKRVEELVGRPVWTHEMGSRTWDKLVEEAGHRNDPGIGEVINRLESYGKPVIIV